jgi:transglutaminase-like putative cysteine protease
MSAVCYTVRHETHYRYRGKVAHSHQQLHLTPRSTDRQWCLSHQIDITPEPSERTEYVDAFGNVVTRLELERPHGSLQVVAQMRVQLEALPAMDPEVGDSWESVREQLRYNAQSRSVQWLEAMRFRGESPYVRIKRAFGDFAADCLTPGATVLQVATAVMAKVHREFRYEQGATEIATPLTEVFEKRRGVCQDFAHMMIASLRSAGLAARYVSGYLYTHRIRAVDTDADTESDAEGEVEACFDADPDAAAVPVTGVEHSPKAAEELLGADASHAWVAVFAPPHGWIAFDPTNNLVVNQEHVTLAWGRDFGDVSPLRGVILGGGSHRLRVKVEVERQTAPCSP